MGLVSPDYNPQYPQVPTEVLSNLSNIFQNYLEKVNYRKRHPFFNQNNTVPQWINLVKQDVAKRGLAEGLHDITYPITTSPYIDPIIEPVTSRVRMVNYRMGRPLPIVNSILGQTDKQMSPPTPRTPKLPSNMIEFFRRLLNSDTWSSGQSTELGPLSNMK